MASANIKVAVLGTRGFPDIQGGVEAYCENIYPRLAKLGCEITVFTRKPYVKIETPDYRGVKLIPLTCPKNKFLEAFVHTLKGVLAAKKIGPDIVHIHAVGPSLCVPIARIFGLRVVVTNHGPDYMRKKWPIPAKAVLLLGEMLGSFFSNEVICISKTIADDIKKKYGRNSIVIPNGVEKRAILSTDEALKKYKLEKGKYILAVGRFVPEKGFGYLIDAFSGIRNGWKLVVVGKADHEDAYSRDLIEKAKKNSDVIFTGFLSGEPLQELYSHAGLFILPSYYEGLPIALLEAMSYGLSCIASDIAANRIVGLSSDRYFESGNITDLANKILNFMSKPFSYDEKSKQIAMIAEKYDWDEIARNTLTVYHRVIDE